MRRRGRTRWSRVVRAAPDYYWAHFAGAFGTLVDGENVSEVVFDPTEIRASQVTGGHDVLVERLILRMHGYDQATNVNYCTGYLLHFASHALNDDDDDLLGTSGNLNEAMGWVAFHLAFERVIHEGIIDVTGDLTEMVSNQKLYPVPVQAPLNMRVHRKVRGDEVFRITLGAPAAQSGYDPTFDWYARWLVRTGVK